MNHAMTDALCGARHHLILVALTGALALGCGDDAGAPAPDPGASSTASTPTSDGGTPGTGTTPVTEETPPTDVTPTPPEEEESRVAPAPACDPTRRPIVFAHGFLASGDTFANHAMRFEANGYCLDHIVAFDWNTLNQGQDNSAALDAFIDALLARTGASQVDLAGHSAGGGLSYAYLAAAERAAKVAHYVHIGSQVQSGPAGPAGEVPTLNLWSDGDVIIEGKADIPGAQNVMLSGADHYAVATNVPSFEAMYRFYNDDEAPLTTDIAPDGNRTLHGRVLTLGENEVGAGFTVDIHACDPETGFRLSETPDAVLTTDDGGYWGPFEAAEGTYYEFHVHAANEQPIHYYFEPFVRSNSLVYLRTMPGPGSMAGQLMSAVPKLDTAATVVIFSSSHAMLEGADSLTLGGTELLTSASATAADTLLALFLYDANENGATDGTPAGFFGMIPFLNGTDVHIPSGEPETVAFTFNGRTVRTRNWSAGLEGQIVVVFR